MKNKICMVTGATSGMGLITAEALAHKGARVIVVGRNPEKCEQTVKQIKNKTGNSQLDFIIADLSSQEEIRKLAKDFKSKYSELHVLVNNAGGFFIDRQISADDIEMTFALDHLSYFLLTNLLLDVLKNSAPSRIVNVSSAEHLRVKFDPNKLQGEKIYNGWSSYCQSKLANILFTYELSRRLSGTGVTVNVLHPGFVKTNIGKNNGILAKFLVPVMHLKAITPEEGAKTCIHLASSYDVNRISGKYFDKMKIAKSSPDSYNLKNAKQLWEISEKLTELR